MHRCVRATIDLSAFRANHARARVLAGARAVWPVIKGDAYGHGMLALARALPDAPGFCVADLDEALLLREAGLRQPILVLQGAHDGAALRVAAEHWLTLGVHAPEQVELIVRDAPSLPARALALWLKVDTGMHRLGLDPAELDAVRARLSGLRAVRELGVMTHFACADEPDHPLNLRQRSAFAAASRGLAPRSACNSAALLAGAPVADSIVRPGIMLYGASPLLGSTAAELGLAPVMTLSSRVIAIRTVAPGETVGYGATWTARRTTRVGYVAVGYGDGYPRHAPTGTPVRTLAGEVPTLGRVSMDSISIDLTGAPSVRVGDSVTLWGQGLDVDRVARAAGTLGYELLTRLTARVPRVVRERA
ncbi:MAG: alanine racemase [Pseudomonadales bacterium]|jgi:alanine racemase|nr:alanine racemase [Pseudomonadales bacterium]